MAFSLSVPTVCHSHASCCSFAPILSPCMRTMLFCFFFFQLVWDFGAIFSCNCWCCCHHCTARYAIVCAKAKSRETVQFCWFGWQSDLGIECGSIFLQRWTAPIGDSQYRLTVGESTRTTPYSLFCCLKKRSIRVDIVWQSKVLRFGLYFRISRKLTMKM